MRISNSVNTHFRTSHQQSLHMSTSHSTASTLSEDWEHISTTMTNQSASLADPVLLEKIDKFFELGIGEYVALPQVRNLTLYGHVWLLTTA